MKKTAYLVGGIAAFVFALFAAVACWFGFQTMQASADWPSTKGVIDSSTVERKLGIKQKWQANVLYSYRVDGRAYSNNRLRFADTTGSAKHLQEAWVERYPAGAQVDVYYDPNDMSNSVLEPGGGARGFLLVLPPLLLIAIGSYFLAVGLQMKRPKKRVAGIVSGKRTRRRQ